MSLRAAALLLVLVAVAAGCGGGETVEQEPAGTAPETVTVTQPGETTAPTETAEQPATRGARVYFARGEWVGPAARQVEGEAVGRAVMESLLSGPTAEDGEAGLTTSIPDGTSLLGLDIADGVATVDLSGEFDDGGGTLSMTMRLAQVVYTLTQFETVDGVLFRIDGDPVEAFGGEGILLEQPVGRDRFEDVTPGILVETPLPWQTVSSPLRIAGTANTFEANFHYELADAGGNIVAENFVTATSGSGERGTFEETIEFDPGAAGGELVLRVWEPSAEDGSRTKLVEIPLRAE